MQPNNRRQGDPHIQQASNMIATGFILLVAVIILASIFGLWLKFFWWGWIMLPAC